VLPKSWRTSSKLRGRFGEFDRHSINPNTSYLWVFDLWEQTPRGCIRVVVDAFFGFLNGGGGDSFLLTSQ